MISSSGNSGWRAGWPTSTLADETAAEDPVLPLQHALEVPLQGLRVLDDRAELFETGGTAAQLRRLDDESALVVGGEQGEGLR